MGWGGVGMDWEQNMIMLAYSEILIQYNEAGRVLG